MFEVDGRVAKALLACGSASYSQAQPVLGPIVEFSDVPDTACEVFFDGPEVQVGYRPVHPGRTYSCDPWKNTIRCDVLP